MKKHSSPRALETVERVLRRRQKETRKNKPVYYVPSLWVTGKSGAQPVKVNPYVFYLAAIAKIKRAKPTRKPGPSGGEWTKDAVIYNMFVRTTTAFDHNRNKKLDLPVNEEGFRETGTFLKAIALLPYIKRLGANTVHLLPITSIGHDGNKGTLGSPYAIRNPYELDDNLSEPGLRLDAKTEFKAFVEAAHRLGLRVVLEFVFRTAAKDADWVKEHPEWLYWIKDDLQLRDPGEPDESRYGSPIFTKEELERIHAAVRGHHLGDLIPPHSQHQDFFTAPPPQGQVRNEHGRYVGVLPDGTRVKIPGAFADWPPDDNQPPWGDVTYLRMYTHPKFNYIGYNTIRMYDTRLTQPEYVNRPLWDMIVGIIPYYQKEFRIDGVMIDMGHALPMDLKAEMVKTARGINHDFAFWDENFSVTQKSREEGYNAVFGFCWIDEAHLEKMKNLCRQFSTGGYPIPFFSTPENHNTPRAAARPGGIAYAKWALVINAFLPAVPFIHSGYELGECYPINTGLDFTHEELRRLPSEKLPLFSEYGYDWLGRDEFVDLVRTVLKIREKHRSLVTNHDPNLFHMLDSSNPHLLAYARGSDEAGKKLAVIGNANYSAGETAYVSIRTTHSHVVDLLTGKKASVEGGQVGLHLKPGECLVFEF